MTPALKFENTNQLCARSLHLPTGQRVCELWASALPAIWWTIRALCTYLVPFHELVLEQRHVWTAQTNLSVFCANFLLNEFTQYNNNWPSQERLCSSMEVAVVAAENWHHRFTTSSSVLGSRSCARNGSEIRIYRSENSWDMSLQNLHMALVLISKLLLTALIPGVFVSWDPGRSGLTSVFLGELLPGNRAARSL